MWNSCDESGVADNLMPAGSSHSVSKTVTPITKDRKSAFTLIELLACRGIAQRATRLVRFTLIELLVVIAIISILASLLLPALKKAKNISRTVICTANIKQVGQWGFMYTSDFNGFLPTNGCAPSSGIADGYYWECGVNRWFEKLALYYPLKKYSQQVNYIYRCPQVTAVLTENEGLKGQPGDSHYQVKCSYGLHMWRGGGYNALAKSKMPVPKIVKMKPTYEWFSDANAKWYPDGPGGGKGAGYYFSIQSHHSNYSYPIPWMWRYPQKTGHSTHSANFMYGDGHAQLMTPP